MPLGISFFTFQGLTYLFALEKIPSQKENLHIHSSWEFLKLFAFIGFFPTVFSGPILRAKEWDTEISQESSFTNNVLNIGREAFILSDNFQAESNLINNLFSVNFKFQIKTTKFQLKNSTFFKNKLNCSFFFYFLS